MISHEAVSTKSSLDGDKCANPPQDPMTLQNMGALGSHKLHPQKLIQLVGCRLLDAPQEKPKIASG
jgi:hypothetical protein